MTNILFILLATFSTFEKTTLEAHQFHVSKAQVEYSAESEALQISLHIFLDDLEFALEEKGASNLFLCSEREAENAEEMLQKYLSQQFQIKIDGTTQTYQYIGKEISEDLAAVWCYFEIPKITAPKSIEVTNEILMDLYDDQKNIVHIIGPDNAQGYFMFQKGNSTDKVEF